MRSLLYWLAARVAMKTAVLERPCVNGCQTHERSTYFNNLFDFILVLLVDVEELSFMFVVFRVEHHNHLAMSNQVRTKSEPIPL